MAGQTYDSVPVRVERRDDQGVYVVGVVIDNAFLTIASVKTGHVDELVERERENTDARATQEQAEQEARDADERARVQREAEQQHSQT